MRFGPGRQGSGRPRTSQHLALLLQRRHSVVQCGRLGAQQQAGGGRAHRQQQAQRAQYSGPAARAGVLCASPARWALVCAHGDQPALCRRCGRRRLQVGGCGDRRPSGLGSRTPPSSPAPKQRPLRAVLSMQIDPARKGAGTHPGEERPVGEGGGPRRSPALRLWVLATPVLASASQCPATSTQGARRVWSRLSCSPPEVAARFVS